MQVAGGGDCFVSLFCGSCAVESKVQGFSRKILNDRHEYLIAMLQGVQQGYNLPEHITQEQNQYIRENKDADPVLAGFVGFGCSFGGKWFGGYARNKTGTNYAEQSKRSLLKDMAALQDAQSLNWMTDLKERRLTIETLGRYNANQRLHGGARQCHHRRQSLSGLICGRQACRSCR